MSMGIFIVYFYGVQITRETLRAFSAPDANYAKLREQMFMLDDCFKRRVNYWNTAEGREKRVGLCERMESWVEQCEDGSSKEALAEMRAPSVEVIHIEDGSLEPHCYVVGIQAHEQWVSEGIEALDTDDLVAALNIDTRKWDEELKRFLDAEGLPADESIDAGWWTLASVGSLRGGETRIRRGGG